MSSRKKTLREFGVDAGRRPKRDPSRDSESVQGSTDASNLTDYGADIERTHVPDDELEGDASSEALHDAADDAKNILAVSNELRLPYHVARHDLGKIGRRDELSKGKSLAEKLRGQD